jgi:hypothetical protein
MGLPQHTHEMTWRCVAIVGFDAMFFCKILARWVVVLNIDELCEMEIRPNLGASCRRLCQMGLHQHTHKMTWRCVGPGDLQRTREYSNLGYVAHFI